MRLKFLVSALALFVVAARADVIIETNAESPQGNYVVTMKIKGTKVRADLNGPIGPMSSIMDSATGESIQLIHSQKIAMKTNAEQTKQMLEMARKGFGAGKSDAAEPAPAKIQPTGEKEKIGEYHCEIYAWAGNGTSSRYWVALQHPQAAQLKAADQQLRTGVLGGAMNVGPDVSTLPGPVLKTENLVAGTKTTITVISVKEATIEAGEFDAPQDYKGLGSLGLPPSEPAVK